MNRAEKAKWIERELARRFEMWELPHAVNRLNRAVYKILKKI